jgi:hypothetical protein
MESQRIVLLGVECVVDSLTGLSLRSSEAAPSLTDYLRAAPVAAGAGQQASPMIWAAKSPSGTVACVVGGRHAAAVHRAY